MEIHRSKKFQSNLRRQQSSLKKPSKSFPNLKNPFHFRRKELLSHLLNYCESIENLSKVSSGIYDFI